MHKLYVVDWNMVPSFFTPSLKTYLLTWLYTSVNLLALDFGLDQVSCFSQLDVNIWYKQGPELCLAVGIILRHGHRKYVPASLPKRTMAPGRQTPHGMAEPSVTPQSRAISASSHTPESEWLVFQSTEFECDLFTALYSKK